MAKAPPKPRTFAQEVDDEARRRTSAAQLVEASSPFSAAAVQLSERIRQLVDLFDSQTEAANVAGRSRDSVQNWITGKAVPAFDSLARLAGEKNVSLNWLATGSGSMFEGERLPAVPSEFVYIPRYEVRAGAGAGQIVESENLVAFVAFRSDWVRSKLRRNPQNLAVLEAFGDSMHPTIKDGDIMLVDTSEERVRGNAIYVLLAGAEAIVKRIELTIEGWLLVKSDNPAYETRTLKGYEVGDLRVIGKVVWAGGTI